MKRLLLILILTICFQSSTKADDISQFEIEGISIGDSLLKYFSKKEIKDSLATYYKDNKHSTARTISNKYENYDQIDISFVSNDKNYKIIAISAALYTRNIPQGCEAKSEEINTLIKKTLDEAKYFYQEQKTIHPVDSSGKSTVESKYYYFDNGDLIAIQCYNFSEETDYTSSLKLQIAKSIHVDWLEDEAYK